MNYFHHESIWYYVMHHIVVTRLFHCVTLYLWWYISWKYVANNSYHSHGKVHKMAFNAARGPFYQHGVSVIPPWISDYIHYKVWDEFTYPFTNFTGATIEIWEWIGNFLMHLACDYLSMLRLKLINFSKKGPRTELPKWILGYKSIS